MSWKKFDGGAAFASISPCSRLCLMIPPAVMIAALNSRNSCRSLHAPSRQL